ncbi:MAG TPA: preprotein translocase subunit YajC [Ignavibacteriaceae bacterium]|nr:preprotein translocase subunit YajC [Ignavibacteriaceae bacterium]
MNYLLAMAPPAGGNGGGGFISTIIMFGAIFLIFYFMIIRPQQKRAKEREKLLSNLQKGDKVVTSGGLHGTIAGIDEKTVLLQVSDNVKMKFERSAIANVIASKDTL